MNQLTTCNITDQINRLILFIFSVSDIGLK